MPWNLSENFLMRSSVDLIGTVFLGVAGAGVGQGRWEVPWMTLTVQFILTTSNLSHEGKPSMQDRGVCHITTGVYLAGLCTGGTRLPDDGPMK